MNHHYEENGQKYALDIVKLNTFGFRCNMLHPSVLESYNIYGDILYSPCKGTIVELVDKYPDLDLYVMDSEHLAGNYLAIEMENSNVIVFLAHIMTGSFLVKQGEIVEKGQLLAKVGKSGNSSEPHLHIHAVLNNTERDYLFNGEGIPIKFNDRFLIRNDLFSSN